jgi:RimJ/RimL family protein N-acetyltransferase
LLLRHAFDDLGALRVQLKTDNRNERSKAAIQRIGAKPEGLLRCDRVLWDGFVRDSAYFSIVHHEWPAVKAELERKLRKP